MTSVVLLPLLVSWKVALLIVGKAASEWMFWEKERSFGMGVPLHAAPRIKNKWNQAIFEIVIGSPVTFLHHFEFHHNEAGADTTEGWWNIERNRGGRVHALDE